MESCTVEDLEQSEMVREGVKGSQHLVVEVGDLELRGFMASESSSCKWIDSRQSSQQHALSCSVGSVDCVDGSSLEKPIHPHQTFLLSWELFSYFECTEEESP